MRTLSNYINSLTLLVQIFPWDCFKSKTIKSRILLCFFLVISVCPNVSIAQLTFEPDKTTRFEKLSVEQGLSSRYITCIHQDKYGFVWIGTQNGLNLYDGMESKIFRSESENPNSLPNNYIYKILEDKDSTIWICSEFGLSKFNRASEGFTNSYPDTMDYFNPINQIREIYILDEYLMLNVGGVLNQFSTRTGAFYNTKVEMIPPPVESWSDLVTMLPDSLGVLWVFTKDGQNLALSRYNCRNRDSMKYISSNDESINFSNLNITSVFKVYPNVIWLGTFGNGLYKLIVNKSGSYSHEHYDRYLSKSIISNYITQIYQDRKSNIWVGAKFGFYKLIDGGHVIPSMYDIDNTFIIENYGVRSFSEDNKGCFWMTTRDGIFCFNMQNKDLIYFTNDPLNPNSLSGIHPFQAFTDQSDQTWIVTENSGISRLNTNANSFLQIRKNSNKNALSNDWVTSFLVDSKGNFWVGTFGGGLNKTLYKKDHHFDNFKHYFNPADEKLRFSFYANFDVSVIYEDKKDDIWVGTYEALYKYNPESDDFIQYKYSSDSISIIGNNVITAIFEDHLGTFWVGTQGGLNIFDRETEKYYPCIFDPEDSTSIGGGEIRAIYEDNQNNLWFGGKYLKKLVRNDTSFITYKPDPKNPKSINDENVRAIVEDKNNHLWLGTNKGLNKMNLLDGTFIVVNDSNGKQENAISGICMDDHGNLWISKVTGGLLKYNPETGTFKDFNTGDGLIASEFAEGSAYKDKDGWMYFGGFKGFNVFYPDSIKDNTFIPPVYITGFSVFDKKKYYDQPLYKKKELHLNYNENEFTFDFVALNYLNSEKNSYAYMLEGYDKDWNYSGSQRFASYTNMSPGEYVFKVKASNNDGYWNEEGASIALIISPPFWLTIWAYIIYIILFIGLLYIIRRYEMNRLQLKQNLEINIIEAEKHAELDIEKNKFFSNISHEFRTPLTLILGPLERLIGNLKNGEQKSELNLIRRNAQRLQILINQLLSLSKLESGKMKLKARPENIVKLTRLFLQSFNSMAEDRGINLEFESDADEHIVYVDTIKYEKVVNNLLSNAFKFTEKGGEIKVSINLTPLNPRLIGEQAPSRTSFKKENPFSPPLGETKRGVQIKFSDSGIGISKEKLIHVFDRFYQVDEKQMKTNLGTGIGLALTKELVELHHGTIAAESDFGMGTTFTIFLPLGKEHLAVDEIVKSGYTGSKEDEELLSDDYLFVQDLTTKTDLKAEVPVDDNIPLLLIVEDNEDMRNYIKSYLTGLYNIIEATNGKEGAEKAIEQIPDLIVSDLMMPFVDGNEMTIQLKSDERTSHIPIILLTAKASRESKLEGLETGADDFLTKPFDADELLVRIKNLIEQRKKLRMLLSQHIGDVSQTRLIRESSGKMMTSLDEQFIEKAMAIVQDNMSSPELNVDMLAREMFVSRMQLHRKLTSLTDNSASDLIRNLRLKKAAELLKEGELNVTQISYEIGISSLSNFAKIFKEKYGVTPSEYN